MNLIKSAFYLLLITPFVNSSYGKVPEKVHIANDFFYIKSYQNSDSLGHLIYERGSGPGSECKISIVNESTEDLYCILDITNGDLNNVILEYSVPPKVCDYLYIDVECTAGTKNKMTQIVKAIGGNTSTYRNIESNNLYLLTCKDRNYEIKHRIHLIIKNENPRNFQHSSLLCQSPRKS